MNTKYANCVNTHIPPERKPKWSLEVIYEEFYHEYLFNTLEEVKHFIEINENANVNQCKYEIQLLTNE